MNQGSEIRRLGQSVSRLAMPVLFEQICIVIMGMINTMLAANLGKEAISAIGMVDTINNIIISFFSALAIGGTVVVAQYIGHNDPEKANQGAGQALISSLLIAILVTAAMFLTRNLLISALFGEAEAAVLSAARDYFSVVLWSYIPIALVSIAFGILRGAGDTRTPMVVSILMNFGNVIFSIVLIYGLNLEWGGLALRLPALGVRGAAIGLTLARTAGLMLVMIPLLRGSRLIRLGSLRHFRFDIDLLKCIFRLGVPASAEQLMFNGGKLIVQTFLVSLGTVAMAANSIANSVTSLVMVPGSALSIAATTLVGQQIGRGQPKEAQKLLKFLVFSASAAIGMVSLLLLPFLNVLLRSYTQDPATVAASKLVIITYLAATPFFWPMSFIAPSGLRGAGDVRFTMLVSMISMWLLRILMGYVLTVILPLGVLGIWIAMYIDWLGRGAFFLRRMTGTRWMKGAVFEASSSDRDAAGISRLP